MPFLTTATAFPIVPPPWDGPARRLGRGHAGHSNELSTTAYGRRGSPAFPAPHTTRTHTFPPWSGVHVPSPATPVLSSISGWCIWTSVETFHCTPHTPLPSFRRPYAWHSTMTLQLAGTACSPTLKRPLPPRRPLIRLRCVTWLCCACTCTTDWHLRNAARAGHMCAMPAIQQ